MSIPAVLQVATRIVSVPALTFVWWSHVAFAASASCVHFDVGQLASCRVLAESQTADEMLVEAVIDVSTLIRFGRADQVQQLLFVIESPARTLHVDDYSPKTELTTQFASNIERNSSRDRATNLGLNASLLPNQIGTANGSLSSGDSESDAVQYQTLPPKQLLVASGTIARGTAVYFKFSSTPQTTLDGSRELKVLFRVPATWRADYVYVRCAAFDRNRDDDRQPLCGSSDFLVPLYLEGDAAAREAARQLANEELQLRRVASRLRNQMDTDRSLSNKFFSMLGQDQQPDWPADWLNTVLTSPPHQHAFGFQRRLPKSAQIAMRSFTAARRHLHQLPD